MSNPRLYQLNTQTGTLVLTGANIGLNVVHNAIFSSNVGIGTTNPTNTYGPTLHIRGANPNLRLEGTGTGSWAWISMNNADAAENRAMGMGADGSFRITNIRDNLDSNVQFTILQGGNVGIGTTNPTIFGGGLEVSRASQAGVRVSATGGANPTAIEIGADSTGNGYVQTVTANARIQFFTNLANVTTMTLTSTGNVGIGTTNPSQRLSVFGSGMVAGFTSNTTTGSITIAHSGNGGTIGYTNSGAGSLSNMFYVTTGAGTVGSGIVMDNGGNVGIGTTNPGNRLTIRGTSAQVDIQSAADSEVPGITMRFMDSNDAGSRIYYNTGDAILYFDNFYPYTASTVYGSLNFRTRAASGTLTSRLYIRGETGRVGIGTTVPANQCRLHVVSSDSQDGIRVDATNYPEYTLARGGSIKAYLSVAGVGGGYITGSPNDSLCIRSESGDIIFGSGSNLVGAFRGNRFITPNQPGFMGWGQPSMTDPDGYYIPANVRYNIGNHFNTSTGLFTAPIAGYYLVMWYSLIDTGASSLAYAAADVYVNGSRYGGTFHTSYSVVRPYEPLNLHEIVYANANDTIGVYIVSPNGGQLYTGQYNSMSIRLLG